MMFSQAWLCSARARSPGGSCGGQIEGGSTQAGFQMKILDFYSDCFCFLPLDVHYIIFLLQVLLANLQNISEIYGVPTSRQDWNYIWEVKYMMRPPLDMPELFLKRDYSPQ